MAAFSLVRSNTGSADSGFAGFGAQYNQNLYATISRDAGVTEEYQALVRQRLGVLKPQFVRIFFSGDAIKNLDLMQSFERTVELAQRTTPPAATINVTFQGIGQRAHGKRIPEFAEVLHKLVTTKKISKLKWVTVRNEPNRPAMNKDFYHDLYRQLDRELTDLDIRSRIQIMGGDLLVNKQEEWFKFLASDMADLLDAYSIHVYWDYRKPAKIENRLRGVRRIWDDLPAGRRKPLYVTEYGVRGDPRTQAKANPGFVEGDTTPLGRTNVNAFQHAWFALLAAKLGFLGAVKWDAYFGRYGTGVPAQTMAFWLIGPPAEPHPTPAYELMRLLSMTVGPGASVVDFAGDPDGKVVVGFAGPNDRLAVLGLDTRGGTLNPSAAESSYRLENLPRNTEFQLRYWNHGGRGRTVTRGRVRSDRDGLLTLTAPVQSVFALTSLRAQ